MARQTERKKLTDEGFQLVAQRFKVLSEPVRLKLLAVLQDGEQNVGQLVQLTGYSQANVSKHLATLLAAGMLGRRKEGLNAFYFIGDPQIGELCDLMCSRIEREFAERKSPLA